MTIEELLHHIATHEVDAKEIADRFILEVDDVRAALKLLARGGLALPVAGGRWTLATDDVHEALVSAPMLGFRLGERVEGFGRKSPPA